VHETEPNKYDWSVDRLLLEEPIELGVPAKRVLLLTESENQLVAGVATGFVERTVQLDQKNGLFLVP